jgi:hypothetical protein
METIRSEKFLQLLKLNFHFVSFFLQTRKKSSRGFALIWSRADHPLRALFVRVIKRSRFILSIRYFGPKSYQNTFFA